MNSTKWYTLTEFVQHLSKTGQVRADQTDKGWFISVIQPDPEEKLAEERRHKRDRAERVCSCLSTRAWQWSGELAAWAAATHQGCLELPVVEVLLCCERSD